MEKTTRDLREDAREQIKRVYNRAYDEAFTASGGDLIEAGVLAVAEWARQNALERAASTLIEHQWHRFIWGSSQGKYGWRCTCGDSSERFTAYGTEESATLAAADHVARALTEGGA